MNNISLDIFKTISSYTNGVYNLKSKSNTYNPLTKGLKENEESTDNTLSIRELQESLKVKEADFDFERLSSKMKESQSFNDAQKNILSSFNKMSESLVQMQQIKQAKAYSEPLISESAIEEIVADESLTTEEYTEINTDFENTPDITDSNDSFDLTSNLEFNTSNLDESIIPDKEQIDTSRFLVAKANLAYKESEPLPENKIKIKEKLIIKDIYPIKENIDIQL